MISRTLLFPFFFSCILLLLTTHEVQALGAFESNSVNVGQQLQRVRHSVVEQHSLIPPFLANTYSSSTAASRSLAQMRQIQDDHSGRVHDHYLHEDIPFWAIYGTTVITDNYIRLTPDASSCYGHMINLEPLRMPAFELVVGFKVHSSKSLGADGFAIFIENYPTKSKGPLFGHHMGFRGLAIFVDTYDNSGNNHHPKVSLAFNHPNGNDKGKIYNKDTDFEGQTLGGCQIGCRNTQEIIALTLRYKPKGVVDLVYSLDNFLHETLCVSVNANDVPLPILENPESPINKYYITLSAETGSLSDNHDIHYIFVHPDPGYKYDNDVYKYNHQGPVPNGDNTSAEEELAGKSKHKYSSSHDKQERKASTSIKLEDLDKEIDPWLAQEASRKAAHGSADQQQWHQEGPQQQQQPLQQQPTQWGAVPQPNQPQQPQLQNQLGGVPPPNQPQQPQPQNQWGGVPPPNQPQQPQPQNQWGGVPPPNQPQQPQPQNQWGGGVPQPNQPQQLQPQNQWGGVPQPNQPQQPQPQNQWVGAPQPIHPQEQLPRQ